MTEQIKVLDLIESEQLDYYEGCVLDLLISSKSEIPSKHAEKLLQASKLLKRKIELLMLESFTVSESKAEYTNEVEGYKYIELPSDEMVGSVNGDLVIERLVCLEQPLHKAGPRIVYLCKCKRCGAYTIRASNRVNNAKHLACKYCGGLNDE